MDANIGQFITHNELEIRLTAKMVNHVYKGSKDWDNRRSIMIFWEGAVLDNHHSIINNSLN